MSWMVWDSSLGSGKTFISSPKINISCGPHNLLFDWYCDSFRRRETDHFCLVLRLSMSDAVLQSVRVFSWYVQGQLYIKEKGTKYKTKRHGSLQFRVLRC